MPVLITVSFFTKKYKASEAAIRELSELGPIVLEERLSGPECSLMAVPFVQLTHEGFGRALIIVGKLVVKNIVALGALQAATNVFPKETFLAAIKEALKGKSSLIPLNEQAFQAGVDAAKAFLELLG